MATVTIIKGMSRGKAVKNQTFTLLKGFKKSASGKTFVTVDGTSLYGLASARILVKSEKDFVINGSFVEPITATAVARLNKGKNANSNPLAGLVDDGEDEVSTETDEEILARVSRRFEILDALTMGARVGDIRALFVCGAPGVGKTFGVEAKLGEAGVLEQLEGSEPKYTIISGAMTPVGLYMQLYKYRHSDNVMVLDDCDSVFTDELALNLLKAALDTSKKRMIHWNVDSFSLRKDDVPNSFEFEGSIIFISNINFRKIRSERLRAHITALMSRSHFLDLTVHTKREKLLRIEDLVKNKGMLDQFKLGTGVGKELMAFIRENADKFNELSLRTIIKLAGLVKTFPNNKEWAEVAQHSLMSNFV